MDRGHPMTQDVVSHRRYNPLMDEWVIVAANRIKRPWQGEKETVMAASTAGSITAAAAGSSERTGDSGNNREPAAAAAGEEWKSTNALAPGGHRANGLVTPEYSDIYIFTNDYPSFTDDGQKLAEPEDCDQSEQSFPVALMMGWCFSRVICYHPSSSLSMSQMSLEQIELVIDAWIEQINELQNKYAWIQIFENKGAMVGCSNPHPHGQLWASDFLPNIPARKHAAQKVCRPGLF
ncbi:unnamed protein product [Gongylonema pulchrum]|uniref:Galactose-1-phosphate uridylyltransferase n=1 Tax=Gongylonema pulchrum TaxID=637853 RepID=A0A183EN63_9BILA|nr:unnamed protein product [Gongylonema pulchrum]